MQAQIDATCRDHPELSQCADSVVGKWPGGRNGMPEPTYGLRVHDGGDSFLQIEYCPWCGQSLLPVQVKLEKDLRGLSHLRRLLQNG
jgi:hypothetical protein